MRKLITAILFLSASPLMAVVNEHVIQGGSLTVSSVTAVNLQGGGTQCVQTNNSGQLTGTGLACGSGSGSGSNVESFDGTTRISSATTNFTFNGTQFIGTLTGGATASYSADPSTFTMRGPDPSVGGDLTGTISNAAVTDDSHAHTSSSISGLDISADTNLAVTYPVLLTGDTVGLNHTFTSSTTHNQGISVTTVTVSQWITASSVTFTSATISGCTIDSSGIGCTSGSSAGQVGVYEATANGSNFIKLVSPQSLSYDQTWELPSSTGTAGQVLQVASVGTSSITLSYASISASGGDSLGTHVATKTITADYGMSISTITVSTITVTGRIVLQDGSVITSTSTLGFDPLDVSQIRLRDDFTGQETEVGEMGELKWGSAGTGSVVRTPGEINHPGIYQTKANASSPFSMYYGGWGTSTQTFPDIATAANWNSKFIVRVETTTAANYYVGFDRASHSATTVPDRGCGWRWLSGTDTNWTLYCKDGVSTSTSTSTVPPTGLTWVTLEIYVTTAGTIRGKVNGGTEVTVTGNIPTSNPVGAFINVVDTGGSATKYIEADFFAYKGTLSR